MSTDAIACDSAQSAEVRNYADRQELAQRSYDAAHAALVDEFLKARAGDAVRSPGYREGRGLTNLAELVNDDFAGESGSLAAAIDILIDTSDAMTVAQFAAIQLRAQKWRMEMAKRHADFHAGGAQ